MLSEHDLKWTDGQHMQRVAEAIFALYLPLPPFATHTEKNK